MRKLASALPVVAVFLLIMLAQPSEEPATIIKTKFGPIITDTHDVGLLDALKALDGSPTHSAASVHLTWPAEAFGASRSQRINNLKGQASDWGAKECKSLINTIASECRVLSAKVDQWSDSMELRLRLDFVPRDVFEPPATSEQRQVNAFDLTYDNNNYSLEFRPETAASERSKIYSQIHRDCFETRDVYGNCLLYRIAISSFLVGKAGDRRVNISGTAWIAVVREGNNFE